MSGIKWGKNHLSLWGVGGRERQRKRIEGKALAGEKTLLSGEPAIKKAVKKKGARQRVKQTSQPEEILGW